jgi:hypothetical protein
MSNDVRAFVRTDFVAKAQTFPKFSDFYLFLANEFNKMFLTEIIIATTVVYIGKKIYAAQNDKKKSLEVLSAMIQTSSPSEGSLSPVIHENEVSEKEKQANYYFKVSSATLGLTTITVISISAPGLG